MQTYRTTGTCSREIRFDITDDQRIADVEFVGGCPGNTVGLAAVLRGMDVDDAIGRLSGIQCGLRGTSCPDQLATALRQYQAAHRG